MNDDHFDKALDTFEKAETVMEGAGWREDECFKAQALALISIAESLIILTNHITDQEG